MFCCAFYHSIVSRECDSACLLERSQNGQSRIFVSCSYKSKRKSSVLRYSDNMGLYKKQMPRKNRQRNCSNLKKEQVSAL